MACGPLSEGKAAVQNKLPALKPHTTERKSLTTSKGCLAFALLSTSFYPGQKKQTRQLQSHTGQSPARQQPSCRRQFFLLDNLVCAQDQDLGISTISENMARSTAKKHEPRTKLGQRPSLRLGLCHAHVLGFLSSPGLWLWPSRRSLLLLPAAG